jgi:hypothetical protein
MIPRILYVDRDYHSRRMMLEEAIGYGIDAESSAILASRHDLLSYHVLLIDATDNKQVNYSAVNGGASPSS